MIEEPLLRLARELAEPGFAAATLVEALSIGLMIDVARYLRKIPAGEERRSRLDERHLAHIRDYVEACDEATPGRISHGSAASASAI